jgi:hypothetical protein
MRMLRTVLLCTGTALVAWLVVASVPDIKRYIRMLQT